MNKDLSKLLKIWSGAILLALVLMLGLKVLDGDTNRLGVVQIQIEE